VSSKIFAKFFIDADLSKFFLMLAIIIKLCYLCLCKQNQKRGVDMTNLEAILTDTNKAKSELMRIQTKLISNGFDKKAMQLEKIIGRLESWQNKK
jgi:hypothetical protein